MKQNHIDGVMRIYVRIFHEAILTREEGQMMEVQDGGVLSAERVEDTATELLRERKG